MANIQHDFITFSHQQKF